MKRALIGLVAALALVLVPLGVAASSYSDSAGDAGSAPDITGVTVSNADDGTMTFRITAGLIPQSAVVTYIDSDLNPSTGPYGVVVMSPPDGSVVSGILDPNKASVPGLTGVSTAGGVIQYQFPKAAIGITDAFAFWVVSVNMVEGNDDADQAPEGNFAWAYMLTEPAAPPPAATVKPVIGKPVAAPAAPVAGKRFTVTFVITRSDDGAPLTSATIGCTTKVAGKVVPHKHTFANGTVKATLLVPKAAKGKQLKVAVKVTAEGQAATKVFTFKVR